MATIETIKFVLGSVADILIANKQPLTDLDQEIGDGDMGITMVKIAEVLKGPEVQGSTEPDIGKFLMATGMAANRAAASRVNSGTCAAPKATCTTRAKARRSHMGAKA